MVRSSRRRRGRRPGPRGPMRAARLALVVVLAALVLASNGDRFLPPSYPPNDEAQAAMPAACDDARADSGLLAVGAND